MKSKFFRNSSRMYSTQVHQEHEYDDGDAMGTEMSFNMPVKEIQRPPQQWNLCFCNKQLEDYFKQWYCGNFRKYQKGRSHMAIFVSVTVFSVSCIILLLSTITEDDSTLHMAPRVTMYALIITFHFLGLASLCTNAKGGHFPKLTLFIFPMIVAVAGVSIFRGLEEVLASFKVCSLPDAEVGCHMSFSQMVLDNAEFTTLLFSGWALQTSTLRVLFAESWFITLISLFAVHAVAALTYMLQVDPNYNLAPELPAILLCAICFAWAMVSIRCQFENHYRSQFYAIYCQTLQNGAGGNNDPLYNLTSDEHIAFEPEAPSTHLENLCEISAKALSKTPLDRLSLLTCRNQDVLLLDTIGQGNFGKIYRARFRGLTVATKTYTFSRTTSAELEFFWHEVSVFQRLRHPNILSFYAASISVPEKTAYCVLELCERGTFEDILANPEYTWMSARREIVLGVARALCYMHSFLDEIIIHHDLKPSNIFISAGLQAKLADFGVSLLCKRHIGSRESVPQNQGEDGKLRGSPVFLAPEVHRGEAFTEKLDVYAFGLVLCEALVGDGLYVVKAFNKKGTLESLLEKGFRPPIPESTRVAKPELVGLLEECWAEDPEARPSFPTITRRLENLVAEEGQFIAKGIESSSSFHSISGSSRGRPSIVLEDELSEDLGSKLASGNGHNIIGFKTCNQEGLEKVDSLTSGASGATVDTKGLSMSTPKSPTGRSYSTFTTSNVPGSVQDIAFLRELCSELQEELRQQSEMYESKIDEQRQRYEEKIAHITETLF